MGAETQRAGASRAEPHAAIRLVTPPEGQDHVTEPSRAPDRLDFSFGAAAAPLLQAVCGDRLSDLHWFRTDWQRGGALTGYAVWREDAGEPRPVVVKLPVPPVELKWLRRLQDAGDVAPKLYAGGQELGGYDIAWVVMERLPHGPLGEQWGGGEFDLLVQAAGRFYKATAAYPLEGRPRDIDWEKALDTARRHVRDHSVEHEQRWSHALKQTHKKLRQWLEVWYDRPIADWCHGDLHLANAMTRRPAPHGPAVLFDFAESRPGSWVEDAVYLEHLFWARRDRLHGRKLCKQIAHERKRLGLHNDADWPRLAEIKRALLAMSTPAVLRHDGNPRHVAAALEVLETYVG